MLLFMIDSAQVDAAINAALKQNWTLAVSINEMLLKNEPKNIDALNRLGFAYLKLGKPIKAKMIFDKVLKIDRYNRIAFNNCKKISAVRSHKNIPDSSPSPLLFLEDPGKTKIIDCINPAKTQVLSSLTCGQETVLKIKKHGIDVRDVGGTYLGSLPDDISFKLIKYIAGGNEYCAHIRHVSKSVISLFIRETKRGKKFSNQPSFASTVNYNPSSRDDNAIEGVKPDTRETGDE